MGTHYHTLGPLAPGKLPRRFIVIACAPIVAKQGPVTPLFVQTLRLGALTYLHRDGECSWSLRSAVFHTGEELLDLLNRYTSRREITWLVANELGYQLTVGELWRHAMRGAISVEGYNLTGRYCTARIRVGGKVLHCVDSGNYVDKGLHWTARALGKVLAPPFQDTDADSDALDKARLEVGVVCELVQRVTEVMRDYGGNSWGWSLGSLAWQSWRCGLMGCAVQVHVNPGATELERAAYLGGRTECRFIGEVNYAVYELDYNSLYAHVMRSSVPVQLDHLEVRPSVSGTRAAIANGSLCVARVLLEARHHDYPYFFWPGKSTPAEGPQTMPRYAAARGQYAKVWGRGQIRTCLATPELQRALEAGEVASIDVAAWYRPGSPFNSFVKHWYDARLHYRARGSTVEQAVCKRLLTVMHGKFGQHSREWVDQPGREARLPFGHWTELDASTGEMQVYRSLAGCVQLYRSPGEWKHSFPAISAHVTSGARVLTDAAVEIAGSIDCYYYDTDALHVTRVGMERLDAAGLLHETELGRMKLKGPYNGAAYRNVGDFRLGPSESGRGPRQGLVSGATGLEAQNTSAAAARVTDPSDHFDSELSAVHGGSVVGNLLRAGPDCWRSCLSVAAARRNRYVGRIGTDGWVRPLWLPEQWSKPEQAEMFSDEAIP